MIKILEDNKEYLTIELTYNNNNDIIIISQVKKFNNIIDVFYNINKDFYPLKYGDSYPFTVLKPFKTVKEAVLYFNKWFN